MNGFFRLPPGFKCGDWVSAPPIEESAVQEMRREAARARDARWRAANLETKREQGRRAEHKRRDDHYERPFVAIDSEGQTYSAEKVEYDNEGVPHPAHATYLWGASADGGEPIWLKDPATKSNDKRPLGARQIIDWLLSLPEQFALRDPRGAVFVMFTFSYDVTKILEELPYKTAWEICKGKTFPDDKGVSRDIGRSPVLWKDYAISYCKGKFFRLSRLRDPDKPFTADKKGKRIIDASAKITIYDTFGFFQSSFSAVADSMVNNGRAAKNEAELISAMKAKRSKFASETIEEIQAYTATELRLLARQLMELREGFKSMNLRLSGWHGAGAAASALVKRERFRDHYGDDIAALDISPQQEAAHHAYFGGRIELLKQGYLEKGGLHVYDIASAYPAAMVEFPSLADGKWVNRVREELPQTGLKELRATIEAASIVSMFKVRYEFPFIEKISRNAANSTFIPFFPLPYRTKTGGIIFPANGYGWYMRDDVLAAIAWLERFCPNYPRVSRGMDFAKTKTKAIEFDIEEAWIFVEAYCVVPG
jgi:DNA polymerase type B, organellar and viral